MSPLEDVVLRYIRTTSGDYDEVEPQVYDVMLPKSASDELKFGNESEIVRITFDSEALEDYPQSQFLAFGHPSLDQILDNSQRQGRCGKVYLSGYNLSPYDLFAMAKKGLSLPRDISLEFGKTRILHFTSYFFWFQATFSSDQIFQYSFEVGIDRYYNRIIRRLDELCQEATLSSESPYFYPDAGGVDRNTAYSKAKMEVVGKLQSLAHQHKEMLSSLLEKETRQISSYFHSLALELGEKKGKFPTESKERNAIEQQIKALHLEKEARLLELRKKMTLKTELKLTNILTVIQPKIQLSIALATRRGYRKESTLLWNPHTSSIEPIACPTCMRPTLELTLSPNGSISCPNCLSSPKRQIDPNCKFFSSFR